MPDQKRFQHPQIERDTREAYFHRILSWQGSDRYYKLTEDDFDALFTAYPKQYTRFSGKLYRAMHISKKTYDGFRSKALITKKPSSWTKSLAKGKEYLDMMLDHENDYAVLFMIQYKGVALDLDKLHKDKDFDNEAKRIMTPGNYGDIMFFGRFQKEVILPPGIKITRHMIIDAIKLKG